MVIPVIQKDTLLGYVLLNIVLTFQDPTDKNAADPHKNRIIDLIYTDLYGVFSTFWLEKSRIEPLWIKKRIKKILSEKFFLKVPMEIEIKNLSFIYSRETLLTFN